MIDVPTANQAHEDAQWLADHWTHLAARLTPGSTTSSSEVRAPSPDPVLPIDLHVSDLMAEIDWKIGQHYCHQLVDETDDIASVPTTPEARLHLIANRYGHWVTAVERTALRFCDDVTDYRERVRKILEPANPPVYWGDCANGECQGGLFLPPGVTRGTCSTCGHEWQVDEQRMFIAERVRDRLLTYSEIPRALKVIGLEISRRTWETWTSSGTPDSPKEPKVARDTDGFYSLAEVVDRVLAMPKHADRRADFHGAFDSTQHVAELEACG